MANNITTISREVVKVLRKSIGKIFAVHLAYVALGVILFTPLIGIVGKLLLKLSGNSNNTAGQSFLIDAPDGVEVQCYPLADILENRGIGNITVIKFDVEGYEYKVLKPYLAQVDRARLPRYIISEFFEAHVDKTTGNQIELLKAYGYREIMKTDENRILVRSDD